MDSATKKEREERIKKAKHKYNWKYVTSKRAKILQEKGEL